MTDVQNGTGPLGDRALEFTRVMREMLPTVKEPADWAPLTEFVAVDEYERVGNFKEVVNWQQYTELLCRWAGGVSQFEMTLRRVTEVAPLVFLELEERHQHSDNLSVVNSCTVFEFDENQKIRRMDVYLQAPKA